MEKVLQDNGSLSKGSGQTSQTKRTLGILPIRNAVVFPGTVTPLAIGRDKSKALFAEIKPNETIIGLCTQRNSETENPAFGDLYTVGTAASVLKVIKLPQGAMHVIIHGVRRFKILKKVKTSPYLSAEVRLLGEKNTISKKTDHTNG